MKTLLLKVLEITWRIVGGGIALAVVLWIWFSPGPLRGPIAGDRYYASREDFDALVRAPDEDQKALERALEELHQDR